jgi:hypothetical protein
MSATTAPQQIVAPTIRTRALTLGVAVAATVAINLVVLGIASTAGAPMLTGAADAPEPVGVQAVVLASLVPMLLGAVLVVLVASRVPGLVRVLAWVGLSLGAVTAAAPLVLALDVSTGVALALMHLVAGVVWFVAVRRTV